MFTMEGIMNVQREDMHNLWKFYSEQFKMEKSSLEGHLRLPQLNYLHRLLRV